MSEPQGINYNLSDFSKLLVLFEIENLGKKLELNDCIRSVGKNKVVIFTYVCIITIDKTTNVVGPYLAIETDVKALKHIKGPLPHVCSIGGSG